MNRSRHTDNGELEEQTRTIFALLNRTLERAGGTLANLVTMTVFINDARNGDRFMQIRRITSPMAATRAALS